LVSVPKKTSEPKSGYSMGMVGWPPVWVRGENVPFLSASRKESTCPSAKRIWPMLDECPRSEKRPLGGP